MMKGTKKSIFSSGKFPFPGESKAKPNPADYSNGHYSVVAAQILRPNSKYCVAVTTFDAKESVSFRICIVDGEKTLLQQEVTLAGNESRTVTFEIGSIPPRDSYKLVAEGLSGIVFKQKSPLKFDSKGGSVLIQTDKSVYKPGDTVRFRVLVLDRSLKPLADRSTAGMLVFIRDGEGNRVKQWSGVVLPESGVFEADLPLSTEPVLGSWDITVEVAGENQTKSFDVDRYVLPTYEVTVKSPGFTVIDDELLVVVVNAKYTYGKPVVGELTVTLASEQGSGCRWQPDAMPSCTQVVPIDGKAVVEFRLQDLLKKDVYFRDVSVVAKVEETLTGRTETGTTSVRIHERRYEVSLVEESPYIPGMPYHAWIKVTQADGSPVQDRSHPVEVSLRNANIVLVKNTLTLGEDGMAKLNVNLDELEFMHLGVEVKYRDESYSVRGIYKPNDNEKTFMRVRTNGASPHLGKELQFEVRCTDALKYVAYCLLARGELVASGAVDGAASKTALIKLPSTERMLPRAKLLVHYLTGLGQIVSCHMDVAFDSISGNRVQLALSKEEVKPGETIDLCIHAQKESYVGLLAVDQSVLLLKSGNDITREQVTQECEMYESAPNAPYCWYEDNVRDASTAGAILMSNRFNPPIDYSGYGGTMCFSSPRVYACSMKMSAMPEAMCVGSVPAPTAEPTVRSNFPETWIWQSISSCEESQTISKIVPDTITSWIVTGFALSKTHGLGLTEQPAKMNVFLPFFLSIDLPYSVKLGEAVRIPVVVFNYMGNEQTADVVFFNHEQEFEFVSTEDTMKVYEEHHRSVQATIATNAGKTFSFTVKPKKVGHITLKIRATCASAGDSIERQLLVEPEGQPQFINKATLVDLREVNEARQSFTVDIPEDAVPNSTKVEVSVIGDLLGTSIENLDSLIRMPYGCGEQNMLNFVPCIVVLDYLKACGRLSEAIESKAKRCMEVGFQRELTYKHQDGSFSAFGEGDKSGSTWLTAFVARSFQQAASHITIDEAVIDRALEWLAGVQTGNGAFPEVGTVCHKDMQGGAGSGIALTAYTLVAFVENTSLASKYAETVTKALGYIKAHIGELNDVYAHSLAAYALQKAGHELKTKVLAGLDSKATIKGDRKWWSKTEPSDVGKAERCFWDRPCSVDVEMSAYALLATLEANPTGGLEGLPILKWLVSQRNDKGGFQSTQDTVVGLQALARMATSFSATKANIQLSVQLPSEPEKTITVDGDNALVLQKYQLADATRNLELIATGTGCALFQLAYKYHIRQTDGNVPRFTLHPTAKKGAVANTVELSISSSFIPIADQTVSNMAVMEVDLPSGCVVENDTMKQLRGHEQIKKVETKRGDTTLVLYFDNMDASVVSVQLSAYQKHEILDAKPANVTIYDYYDNTRCATSFYEVTA